MMRGLLTVSTFIATLLFPWPLAALLALASASVESLVPLAAGIFIDVLYYAPHAARFPYFSLAGALVTALAFFVRSRLWAGIISR